MSVLDIVVESVTSFRNPKLIIPQGVGKDPV